jgi:uncharacterized membrane protein YoaK (UPF0700 family)
MRAAAPPQTPLGVIMAEAGFARIRARVRAVPVPRVSHIVALYLITSVCGLVDAACFLSMGGVFAEIMTGNLLFLCFYIGTGQSIFGDAKYLLVIAAFLLGALAGGRLLRGPRAELRIGFAVEWVLLVIALVLAVTLHPGSLGAARDVVTSLLAFAMGMQNALVRRHGVPDLATNVMTLTATALVADSAPARGYNENWQRRFASIAIFLVSAILGALLTTEFGPWAPLGLTVALFTVALSGLIARNTPPTGG